MEWGEGGAAFALAGELKILTIRSSSNFTIEQSTDYTFAWLHLPQIIFSKFMTEGNSSNKTYKPKKC